MLREASHRGGARIPGDLPALHALLHEQQDIMERQRKRVVELEALLATEKLAREQAESKTKDLLRRLFGPKSEKIDPRQYALAIDPPRDPRCDPRPARAAAKSLLREFLQADPAKTGCRGGGRRPAPEHLLIERVEIDLPESRKAGLVRIREEITEEIDYRPSQFFRRHYVRPVYAHPRHAHAPIMAPLPARVLPQAGVGTGLIAHLLVSKYVDHLPLHRLEKICARAGVPLSRQKQCRWIEGAAHLLLAVRDRLKDRILASRYVQADETPIRVLDADRPGHAAQAYLWTYLSPTAQSVFFDFSLSRGRDSPERFFPRDWGGLLQSDGYELYASLIKDRPQTVHIGCMAHLRRYLIEALEGGGDEAAALLAAIGRLYRIESRARDDGLGPDGRACLRHARARPILRALRQQFSQLHDQVLPQSALGKAATYALNRWPELSRYAKAAYGHVEIDNNGVERSIRPTKMGMKNWLFVGHPDAGWHSAVIYSVVNTCQLLKVNPHAYLMWVLPKLAAGTSRQTARLLPHDFAALGP